ncbi:uncharacterized protein F4822DRAFT_33359 [Hypoxylon trugodes]|uniref:uncharacterized protein n=1 Tax=Hypoxylon trugodes TaxID=326681 RepID=UPI00219E8554|nr:uncharacterized protein F4822DRAFT_33359 [Hypoxylon trugodes]KAI1393997.1 hypothetical protein F4822DRAFT_33359 [Hypoxylon trugodes]
MAQVAPGLGPDRNEPPCYNCGVRGHMFTACPEEPRKVPAGLEASWARQQSSISPHNDSYTPNKRSKGPVITRYPPPPLPSSSHHTPPLPRFENPLPQPYQSGPIQSYPPRPSYSPGFGNHPPSGPPYDRYGPPGPPGPPGASPVPPGPHRPLEPPAYRGAYGPPYGAPGSVPGPYESHYNPPPGRPSSYFSTDYPPVPPSRADPYPPNPYSHGPPGPPPYGVQQFPPGPPPPYLPPTSFTQPPTPYGYRGPPPGYPQNDYSPPQRDPPPPFYPGYPPPPDPSYGQSHGDDRDRYQRGRGHQRRYDDRRPTEAWHPQDAWHNSPPPNDLTYRDDHRDNRHGRSSYRDDRQPRKWGHGRPGEERRRDRHNQHHPYKSQDKSDKHHRRKQQSASTPNQGPRARSPLDRKAQLTVKTDEDREPGEIVSEPTSASDRGNLDIASNATLKNNDEEFDWDEQTIFLELPLESKVDPIAAPLPTNYSEEVMIPPAFDAKSLKSRFISPRNIDDFAQGIRETRDWQIMQHHPAFLDVVEIRLEKLDDYERAIQKDIAMRNSRRDRGNNSHDVGRHRHGNAKGPGRHHGKDQKKRRWNEIHGDADDFRMEKRHRDFPYDDGFNKRLKPMSPEPGEVIETESQESSYEPSRTPILPVGGLKEAPELKENKNSNPQTPGPNYSSGERDHETTDHQPNTLPVDDQGRPKSRLPTPSDQPVDTTPSYDRPPSRQSSRSRRSSIGSQVSQASSLDPIERELLGMGRPSNGTSDAGDESPKRPVNDKTAKLKRRQPRLEAYSRRW